MQPGPAILSICFEKQQLGNALVEAVRHVMALQDQELASLAAGNNGMERFALALELARKKRDRARQRLDNHTRTHGC